MDFYSASGIPILWCCFFQTIAIGWIFGVKKYAGCIEQMTGFKPNAYWLITWAIIAPGVMAVSLVYSASNLKNPKIHYKALSPFQSNEF